MVCKDNKKNENENENKNKNGKKRTRNTMYSQKIIIRSQGNNRFVEETIAPFSLFLQSF